MNLEGDYDIYEVDLPERWMGLSVGEIDIRKKAILWIYPEFQEFPIKWLF